MMALSRRPIGVAVNSARCRLQMQANSGLPVDLRRAMEI